MQPHTALYILGTIFFVLIYLIDTSSGFVTRVMTETCCNILISEQKEDAHSCDIYCELSPEDQQHEFKMTNRILKRIENERVKSPYSEDSALLDYFEERVTEKMLKMRLHLQQQVRAKSIDPSVMRDTRVAFKSLIKSKTINKKDKKIRGLYSYEILNHPDYIRCQKIEKRIINYIFKVNKSAQERLN